MSRQRYKLIACAVLSRECFFCASKSPNIIDVQILEQGLHDVGESKMSPSLQSEIDKVDTGKYDAILLGYGLCNNGIRKLNAKIPLIVPRAHDCITLLLGSKEKYKEYFNNNPGVFYRSIGWIEHAKSHLSNPDSTTKQMGMSTYQEYVEKYGEDNAEYLMEVLGGMKHYSKLAFIDTQVGDPGQHIEAEKEIARNRNWQFEIIQGNVSIIQRLVDGDWSESDFLVVPPGESIHPDHTDEIVCSKLKA